jgi:hypothetical protein
MDKDKDTKDKPKKDATGQQIELLRTEFVIFFVWQEPIASETASAEAAEGGDNNPAPQGQ